MKREQKDHSGGQVELYQLVELGRDFGLAEAAAVTAVSSMIRAR
jgi:DNA-binding transcriptional regulator PaaX